LRRFDLPDLNRADTLFYSIAKTHTIDTFDQLAAQLRLSAIATG
jgi:hypothetical protein